MLKVTKIFFSWDSILILLIHAVLFFFLVKLVPDLDIQIHSGFVKDINLGTVNYPSNFLYYFIINIFSLFSINVNSINNAAIVILSLSCMLKYVVTKYVAMDYFRIMEIAVSKKIIVIFCTLLLFYFVLPDLFFWNEMQYKFIARITPNVWHNSTVIFLFPFSILLFWIQGKILLGYTHLTNNRLILLTVLVLINAFIKPSYLFVYLPVTGLMILFHKKFDLKMKFMSLLPHIIGALSIGLSYILLFHFQYGSMFIEKSGVMLSNPFELFLKYIPAWNLPFSFLLSCFGLLILGVFSFSKWFKDKLIIYTTIQFVFGILLSIFLIESGPRRYHGNFLWQNQICIYLLVLVCYLFAIKIYKEKKLSVIQMKLITLGIIIHALSGVLYLIYILDKGTYFV